MNIPSLEPNCGSWIIIDRKTNKAVLELFERKNVESINKELYEIKTTLKYLQDLNQ